MEIGRADDEPAQEELDQSLASFGLVLDDTEDNSRPRLFHLWAENEPTLSLWFALQTQWRVGMSGATGLDYTAVETLMRVRAVPRADRRELLEGLQVMERSTLNEWARQAETRSRSSK